MRAALALVLAAAATCLGGCGTSERDQVRAKVEQFVNASAGKDYKALCDQVLAPSLVQRLAASGIGCEQAMEIALGGVQNPTLSIGRITVQGNNASAITLTGARGQQASLDAIELVKTGAGWRISSLASPLASTGKSS